LAPFSFFPFFGVRGWIFDRLPAPFAPFLMDSANSETGFLYFLLGMKGLSIQPVQNLIPNCRKYPLDCAVHRVGRVKRVKPVPAVEPKKKITPFPTPKNRKFAVPFNP